MKRLTSSPFSSGVIVADGTGAMSVSSDGGARATRSGTFPTFRSQKHEGALTRLGLLVLDHVTGHRFHDQGCTRCGAVEHWAL